MRIEICQSYEALSLKAKEIVTSELGQHKALTLCAATGGSPTRMYELLVEEAVANRNILPIHGTKA